MKFSLGMAPVLKYKFVKGENNAYLFVFPAVWYVLRWDLNLLDSQIDYFWIVRFQVRRNYGLLHHSKDSMWLLSKFPRIFHKEESYDDIRREYKCAY
jgi:hypothetical protein